MSGTVNGPVAAQSGESIAGGTFSITNISAQTVLTVGPGRFVRAVLQVVGTTATTFNDCATVGTVAAANQIVSIPAAATVTGVPFYFDWPFKNGITITPGTSAVWSVSLI